MNKDLPVGVAVAIVLVVLISVGGLIWWLDRQHPAYEKTTRLGSPVLKEVQIQSAPVLPVIRSGLMLSFESLETPGLKDARTTRALALHVPAGSPATPFLTPGRFIAHWDGFIASDFRQQFSFRALFRGRLLLKINGKTLWDLESDGSEKLTAISMELSKGNNVVEAHYESPVSGDALIRVYWQNVERPLEPIAAVQASHNFNALRLQKARQLRLGRELIGTMRCTKCHESGSQGYLEEFTQQDAPDLERIGERLHPRWMAHWMLHPKKFRHDAHMPRLITRALAAKYETSPEQLAYDIAAYLASLKSIGFKDAWAEPEEHSVAYGAWRFQQLGCIACHQLPDHAAVAEGDDRIPLGYLREKYRPAALLEFLKKPHAHYAWIRMPDFKLSDVEARQLTDFLLSYEGSALKELEAIHVPDLERGKLALTETGCLDCHGGAGKSTFKQAPAFASLLQGNWSRGCLAETSTVRGTAPAFGFKPQEREALRAFSRVGMQSLMQEALPEYAERHFKALNCAACHDRDELTNRWSHFAEETENFEQIETPEGIPTEYEELGKYSNDGSRPPLTWLGQKLRASWTERFLSGQLSYRPRPWLFPRMPFFPKHAHGLAHGFAQEAGFPDTPIPGPPEDEQLAQIGRELIGAEKGLKCYQCHEVGKLAATEVFEAPGISLNQTTERLHKEFYDRWMLDPPSVVPGTRMTKFAQDGKTGRTEKLEGDAAKQFDAIWQFLRYAPKIEYNEEE